MAKGKYQNHRMSFPWIATTDRERQNELRTDDLFRRRFQPEHHHQRSILEDIPIDMVNAFPTSDALHLFDLGIMKR